MSNDIRKLLNIQDQHITIEENLARYGTHKGNKCKFVQAKLTYKPTHCRQCGADNITTSIYKNDTRQSRITLPMTGTYPTYLLLKKQRFICKGCGASFTAKTPIVKKHCFITFQSKAQVLMKAAEAQSI